MEWRRSISGGLALFAWTAAVVTACGGSTDSGRRATGAGGQSEAPSPGAGGRDVDAAEAPTPIEPFDLCVARAKDRCALRAACCDLPDRVARCEAIEVATCRPDAPVVETYDPLLAARCLEAERRSVVDCHHARYDSPEAAAVRETCRDVLWPLLPGLGQYCGGAPCQQLPDLSVWCDGASDGVGSLRCEAGWPRAGNGESCGYMTTCREGLFCQRGTCAPRLADGSDCVSSDECASGFCTCPDGGCISRQCAPTGWPVASERECQALGAD